jgi:hypothetical protein
MTGAFIREATYEGRRYARAEPLVNACEYSDGKRYR